MAGRPKQRGNYTGQGQMKNKVQERYRKKKEMIITGHEWAGLVRTGQGGSGLVKNDQNWSGMIRFGQK